MFDKIKNLTTENWDRMMRGQEVETAITRARDKREAKEPPTILIDYDLGFYYDIDEDVN